MTRNRLFPVFLPASLASLLVVLATTADVAADEVVLKNGKILVGKTKKIGKTILVVTTLDGTVRIKQSDVDWQRTRNDEQLRNALERIAVRSGAGSCHAQLELARIAKTWGLHEEMWGYLGKVLRSTHHSQVMKRRTREFMAGLEKIVLPKKWRTARPEIKVRELLYRIKRRVPKAKLATVSALLAHVPESDVHLKKRARRVTNRLQRAASVKAIALRPTKGNDRFVYRTAILDSSPDVRREAMQISRDLGRTKAAIDYLAPLLLDDNARFRVRAAEAFGELRDPNALPFLIAAGPTAGMMRRALPSGATRAHMAVIQQIAYIRDFDVEVAQASFIADPKVDVIHAGVVLDVTVIAVKSYVVEVVNAYRGAIRRIVNADPGPDTKKWDAWLKRREELAKASTPPPTPSPKSGSIEAKKR